MTWSSTDCGFPRRPCCFDAGAQQVAAAAATVTTDLEKKNPNYEVTVVWPDHRFGNNVDKYNYCFCHTYYILKSVFYFSIFFIFLLEMMLIRRHNYNNNNNNNIQFAVILRLFFFNFSFSKLCNFYFLWHKLCLIDR